MFIEYAWTYVKESKDFVILIELNIYVTIII